MAVISSAIPIQEVLDLEISSRENKHGRLWMKAMVPVKQQEEILRNSYFGEEIKVYAQEGNAVIFRGRVESLNCHKENQSVQVELVAYSKSIVFSREQKKRSFQDISMTYREIMDALLRDQENVLWQWNMGEDKTIEKPLIQYGETDWDFFKRLASHFHTVIYGDIITGKAGFSFGMNTGKQWDIEEMTVLSTGFCDNYYTQGGYEEGLSRNAMRYIETESKNLCRIGDYVILSGIKYTAFRQIIKLEKEDIIFRQTWGTFGMYRRKRRQNESLCGLKLEGTVRKTEKENVFLQLDLDKEKGAAFAWKWMPISGNFCYQMPEIGTKAVLYLPTCEEEDGIIIHSIRSNQESEIFNRIQKREFVSENKFSLGLYPEQILLNTIDNSITLSDSGGILLDSKSKINLLAQKGITINGKKISVDAPSELTCRTKMSNIEISRDFNFYAPAGVKTQGKSSEEPSPEAFVKPKDQKPVEYWQSAFSAMAAIPSCDIAKGGGDSVAEFISCAAVPKVAKGSTTVAIKEVMDGKKEKDTTFPKVFRSMESYTVKGGYPAPVAES